MRLSRHRPRFYGGVDPHARILSLSILDHAGRVVADATLAAGPQAFLKASAPSRGGLAVGRGCLFGW
jgi:hypothetical protein